MDAERYVQQITESQNRLYGYIFSLVGDHNRAVDVLQETNLVLWRKQSEFRTENPFLPWALGIARYQVLAHVRDQRRDHCLLDAELVEQVAVEAESQVGHLETLQTSLRRCLGELSEHGRELIERRYYHSTPIAEIAESLDRGVSSVKVALMRIRRQLAECVRQRMLEA